MPFIPKDKHTRVRIHPGHTEMANNSFISGWGPVERKVGVVEGAFDAKEVEKGRRGERDWVSAPRGLALIPPGNEIIIIIKKKKKKSLPDQDKTDRRTKGMARCCPRRCTFQLEYLEKLENEPGFNCCSYKFKETKKHLPLMKMIIKFIQIYCHQDVQRYFSAFIMKKSIN